MTLEEIKSRINPAYQDVPGTESYERKWLCDEVERLSVLCDKWNQECDELREDNKRQDREIASLNEAIDRLEAERDRLMLEFCPEEMTLEQVEKWAKHQKPVDELKAQSSEPVRITDQMAYAFNSAIGDASLSASDVEEIKIGVRAAFINTLYTAAPRDEQVETLRRDAERYRWLRDNASTGSIGLGDGWLNADEPADEWDAAIDAAMSKGEEG